jgi:hypothetical protein
MKTAMSILAKEEPKVYEFLDKAMEHYGIKLKPAKEEGSDVEKIIKNKKTPNLFKEGTPLDTTLEKLHQAETGGESSEEQQIPQEQVQKKLPQGEDSAPLKNNAGQSFDENLWKIAEKDAKFYIGNTPTRRGNLKISEIHGKGLKPNETINPNADIKKPVIVVKTSAGYQLVDGRNRIANLEKKGIDNVDVIIADKSLKPINDINSSPKELQPLKGKIKLYHGTESSVAGKIDKEGLRYGDFLTTNKQEALDYAQMRAKQKGTKPVVKEFEFAKNEVKFNPSTGEWQYRGGTEKFGGGKYPEKIYKAINEVWGTNMTRQEIDKLSFNEVRDNASMGLSGGKTEFDEITKGISEPTTDESRSPKYRKGLLPRKAKGTSRKGLIQLPKEQQ